MNFDEEQEFIITLPAGQYRALIKGSEFFPSSDELEAKIDLQVKWNQGLQCFECPEPNRSFEK